jgi:hypothetical protein
MPSFEGIARPKDPLKYFASSFLKQDLMEETIPNGITPPLGYEKLRFKTRQNLELRIT